jgi:hypothetical protein
MACAIGRARIPASVRARAAAARRLRRQSAVPVGREHTVSVTVSGLRHSYDGTTLRNNGGDDLRVYADGTYTFATPVADGSAYAVTVSAQPTGPAQTCTVANGSGTVSGSDVGNVAVSCPFATAYAVGGSVSGLAGNGLRLEYDADNVSLPAAITVAANGSFVFDAATTSAVAGTAYRLRILAQPTGPAQTCILTGGTGTVAAADVSSVAVSLRQPPRPHQPDRHARHRRDPAREQRRRRDRRRRPHRSLPVHRAGGHGHPVQRDDREAAVDPGADLRRQQRQRRDGQQRRHVGIDCPYPTAYSVGGTISGLASATDKVSVLYGASNINFFIDRYLPNGPFSFTAAEVSPSPAPSTR